MHGSVSELLCDLRDALGLTGSQDPVETLADQVRSLGTGEGFKAWLRRAFAAGAASVRETDLGSVDGQLLFQSDKYTIVLNSRKPPTRRLFSLAHEIGHLVLEKHLPYLSSDLKERSLFHPDWHSAEERVVDRLAAAMLMPADAVRTAAIEYHRALGAILAVAKRFGVSIGAAERRYRDITGRSVGILECRYVWRSNKIVVMARGGDPRATTEWLEGMSLKVEDLAIKPLLNRVQTRSIVLPRADGSTETNPIDLCWLGPSRVVCAV